MDYHYFGKDLLIETYNGYSQPPDRAWMREHMFGLIRCFARRKLFRELITAYEGFSGINGVLLLKSHGSTDSGWEIDYGNGSRNAQEIVDEFDGAFSTIFLCSCNPGGRGRIHSENSIVIHPTCKFNLLKLARKNFFKLYFPGEGYVENDPRKMRTLIDEMNASY